MNNLLAYLDQKYYQDIISLMPGHIYWKDKKGAFLGCNLEQARDAGFKCPDDIIGKTDFDMPWSIQADYLREIDLKVMKSNKPITLEEIFELPDGTKRVYLSKKLPLHDENDIVSGVLGISFDITERKQLQEELVGAKEAAEAASQAKTEFLENMRHDLRTPITGIIGMSEIIKKEVKQTSIKEYADNLISSSTILLDFLNNILDAIKILSGDLPTLRRKFSLKEVMKQVVTLVKPVAVEKKLKLDISYDSKMPKYFIGDSTRIQRIFLELLSNALRFTEEGSVFVKLELAKNDNRECIIKCLIKDTGIGISEDKLDEIFVRFKRLTPSYKGIYKGVGLGLTIVKQFIDDIKGEIYCESEKNKGTSFTCIFPLQGSLLNDDFGVTKADLTKTKHYSYGIETVDTNRETFSDKKTSILLVEDQPIAAKMASFILEEMDCKVDVATDGMKALHSFEKKQYDLIFMDVGLPDINGNEITKQIRAKEWQSDKHTPIVALTAHIDTENKQKCIESGMDAVLSKPLSEETAVDILNAFILTRKTNLPLQKEGVLPSEKDKWLSIQGDIIDIKLGLQKVGGRRQLVLDLIRELVNDWEIDLPTIIQYKNSANWQEICVLAHKHLGGSLYCGVPRFQEASARLERYINQDNSEFLDELYNQWLEEMTKVKAELKGLT